MYMDCDTEVYFKFYLGIIQFWKFFLLAASVISV